MKIKNVIIVNDFNYIQGGASKVAIDTANILKENYNVFFFSAVSKHEEELNGINYITTNQLEALKDKNKIRGIINGIYNFKAKREFKRLLITLNPDNTLIHVHGWTKALSCSVLDLAFRMRFKVIITLHDYFTACPNGGYFNYNTNEICKLIPLSYKCIKCNCDSRNYMFKIYRIIRQFVQNKIVKLNNKLEYAIGISDLSINVLCKTLNSKINIKKINNPIDYNSSEIKSNWKKNDYYLYVGRVSKEKGVDIFCKVLTELNKKGIVVGDGGEKNLLEKKYPNIKFVGWKNKEEVKKYMQKARCLIFPSLWYEGAPLTPLESMALGIPCLISGKCAGREYCEKNTYTSYEELKDKILSDKLDFDDLICKSFTYDNYKKNIINFYNNIC